MITLCGFAVSNYYNIVKQALLEKQIPFAEEYVTTGSKEEAVLADSLRATCLRGYARSLVRLQASRAALRPTQPTRAPFDARKAAANDLDD